MKVIIAGSRTFTELDKHLIQEAVDASGFEVTVLISGHHWKGIDKFAEEWAKEKGIPIEPYPAKWSLQGLKAGPIRNAYMASKVQAEACICIHDGSSTGTLSMKEEAEKNNLKFFMITVKPTPLPIG